MRELLFLFLIISVKVSLSATFKEVESNPYATDNILRYGHTHLVMKKGFLPPNFSGKNFTGFQLYIKKKYSFSQDHINSMCILKDNSRVFFTIFDFSNTEFYENGLYYIDMKKGKLFKKNINNKKNVSLYKIQSCNNNEMTYFSILEDNKRLIDQSKLIYTGNYSFFNKLYKRLNQSNLIKKKTTDLYWTLVDRR